MTYFIGKSNELSPFITIVFNNAYDLSPNEIEALLLGIGNFCNGTIVTQHQGLNSNNDWKQSKSTEREKARNIYK